MKEEKKKRADWGVKKTDYINDSKAFFFCPPAMIFHHFPLPLCRFCYPIEENVITLSSYTSPADRVCDKLKCCKIRIAQYLCNSMQIPPDASDVLCSPDGEESGRRECQENWPLKQRRLNKTKPSAYLNVWGRRGFTSEQSCSNMRYLHSVQLPSHCGLGKQYSSPTLPPLPKKNLHPN